MAKSQYVMFHRCLSYMFKSVLKSFRTYIYLFIMPVVMLSLIYYLTAATIVEHSRYILLSSYVLLPIIFNIFLIGYIICEWRDSVFLKQLNNFGISKLQFILSFLIVIFIISLFSVFLTLGCLFILDSTRDNHILQQWIMTMKTFSQWFGLFFSITLNIILIFFIGLLTSGVFKNIYFVQASNLLIVFVSIIFGDFLINMSYSFLPPIIIFSYCVPEKYIVWINYIFYTESNKYFYNFFNIVPTIDDKLSFTSIYQPIFSVLGFISLFSSTAYFTFLNSNKR